MRRPRLLRITVVLIALIAVLAVLAPQAPFSPSGDSPHDGGTAPESPSTPAGTQPASNPCIGTITDPPEGTTLITIQGFRYQGIESTRKTPGLLVGVAPDGRVIGVHNNSAHGRRWTYDVDPLPDGNLLLATTEPGITVVEWIDPATGAHLSTTRYRSVTDAHDVDLNRDGSELVMVDKGRHHNRVIAFNASTHAVEWQWEFASHYPTEGGGPYPRDWTHVNDVDEIAPGEYLVSVRNFDQVIVVNRSTNQIDLRLGRDDARNILYEQHNPQYLDGPNGTPTILVADSENDRVVEYARRNRSWERTWELSGGGLHAPRDADRLPNGNTLVVDRLGHRTLEVTPDGRVVWEFYSPWQPYDAERYRIGDEPGGPTMAVLGETGRVTLTESASFSMNQIEACSAYLNQFPPDGRLVSPAEQE